MKAQVSITLELNVDMIKDLDTFKYLIDKKLHDWTFYDGDAYDKEVEVRVIGKVQVKEVK
jgi:hypothetical protein